MIHSACDSSDRWQQLLDIMRALRAPDGCPWDREQTHDSIRQNLIEECYEALEGIDRQDDTLLCEELGDVLLQVVFHAQIAAERGAFDIDAVLAGLCDKLIVRHEHVFGPNRAADAAEALQSWDNAKRRTKGERTDTERLRAVPVALPALMCAAKLASRARKAGLTQPPAPPAQDAELAAGHELWLLTERLGAEGLDAEQALARYCAYFIDRFAQTETG